MKRLILVAVLAAACGGMEIDEAEAAPSTKTTATSCATITAANKSSARKCSISIASGSCSVVSGPCSSCTLAANSATVTFNAPIAPTMALQAYNLPSNIDTSAAFSKSCSATQTMTWTVGTSSLIGTQWTLTDQDPNNPS